MNIKEKFIKYITNNNLINKNEKIVLAISGGPDSVALFHLLNEIKNEYNLTFYFAHINHLLRGDNSDGDEYFVKKLGKQFDVQVFVKRENIRKIASDDKIGEEEAGRKIRYNFFNEIKLKTNSDKVALAHNLDDNVETFLFRLMRGSSIDGLSSIPLTRDFYIRPIMNLYKKEIISYLHQNNFSYRIDETNNKTIYTRNKIRLNLIPYIEKEFNINFKDNITNLINEIKEVNTILDSEIEEFKLKKRIKLHEINFFSDYLKKKLINEKLKFLNIPVNRNKIEEIMSILKLEGTKEINLGKNYYFIKKYDEFSIEKKISNKKNILNLFKMKIGETIFFNGFQISIDFEENLLKNAKKNENYYFIDYNKLISDEFVIRTRRAGDYFIPIGMKSRKKIKDFFINEKIDKYKRNLLPIIVNDDKIVCVGNLRMSEEFKISDKTKKLIKIELKEVGNCE